VASGIHRLKSFIKRGPRMSRVLRAEYLRCGSDTPAHSLTPEIIAKIQSELERLDGADKPPHVRDFVRRMRERYPELRA
jgi:hypothetical protein